MCEDGEHFGIEAEDLVPPRFVASRHSLTGNITDQRGEGTGLPLDDLR